MKALSIWQPYASLIVTGNKFFETRAWPLPRAMHGQRIAIHSTKTILPQQRALWEDAEFRGYYDQTGLPAPEKLAFGCVVGSVILHSCEVIDAELLDDVTSEEQLYGYWEPGNYAWRLRQPVMFHEPIPAKGFQGFWNWGDEFVPETAIEARTDKAGSRKDWGHLRVI